MHSRLLATSVAVVFLLGAEAASMRGQTSSAQVSGRITDPTDAVIPGVSVTVRNVDTGIEQVVTTNELGYYTAPFVQPGNYQIDLSSPGFRSVSRTGIKIDVNQQARFDFQLEVGQVTEVIEVIEAAPLLESESSTIGQVIENKSVVEMPLNGRNAWYLTQMAGATVMVRGIGDAAEIPVTTVAGSRAFTQGLFVDGGSVQKTGLSRAMAEMAPMVDALEEFKVITNNYAAEYGRTAGGVFTAVTKSGTNQFHGNAFEFLRNDALDARNFFAKTKAPLRFNQFGGTLGGPIQKDRTHFFIAYEATRTVTGRPIILTVPTQDQRDGVFTGLVDNRGRSISLYDPNTTRPDPADPTKKVRDPFKDNLIPPSLFDPVGSAAASYYPLPNQAGTRAGGNNFNLNLAPSRAQNHTTVRLDHTISDRDKVFGRYLAQHNNTPQESAFPEPAASGLGGLASRNVNNLAHTAMASWMHSFSPSWINDLKFHWLKQNRDVLHDSVDGGWPAKLGLAGVSDTAFPAFRPQAFSPVGGATAVFRIQRGPTFGFSDSVTYISGKHTVKTGFEFRWNGSTDTFKVAPSGNFIFSRQGTGLQATSLSGNGFATMLLGFATRAQIRDSQPLTFRNQYYGWYLQDDWKVLPNLTLNLGLRYDVETPRTSPNDTSSAFDDTRIHPIGGFPGVIRFAGVDGEPRTPFDTDFNNVGPRLGFSWRPFGGDTVVRGGYGIFFGNLDDRGSAAGPRAVQGFATEALFVSPDQNQTAAMLLRNGFPPYDPPNAESRTDAFGYRGPALYFERPRKTPYSQQFNFGIQHQAGRVLLEAQYIGNLGRKLTANDLSRNQVPPERVGQPGSIQSRRPFPHLSAVNVLSPNLGASGYHGLLLRAEKRYSNGLQFLATYTFSKMLDNVDSIANGDFRGTPGVGYQDFYNRHLDKSLSPLDITHNLTFNTIWDLPAGPGRRYVNSGPLSQIIGGWQLSILGTLFTGPVYGVVTQQNTCECASAGPQRPNILRDPDLPAGQRSVQRWFDTEAFEQPARFTFGNAARAVGRAPGRVNFEVGIMKNFPFKERYRLQLRAELFNAFNHPNFGIPGTTFGAPTFGTINRSDPGRIVQFGLKLYF